MKLTVVGCSGSVSGPGVARVQLPGPGPVRGPYLLPRARPAGPAAFGALYRYLDPSRGGRGRPQPPPPGPLPGPVRPTTSPPATPRPRRGRGPPAVRTGRHTERLARAYDVPLASCRAARPSPASTEHFDFAVWQPASRSARSPSTPRGWTTPWRRTRCGSPRTSPGAAPGLLRRHRALCRAGRAGPGRRPAAGRRRRSSNGPDNPPGLHLTGRQAAEAGAAAGVGAVVLTHIPPWHDPRPGAGRGRRPHFDGPRLHWR